MFSEAYFAAHLAYERFWEGKSETKLLPISCGYLTTMKVASYCLYNSEHVVGARVHVRGR